MGHVCGDDMNIINNQPVGCVRISFGYMSTLGDADTFLKFISDNFVENQKASITHTSSDVLTTPVQQTVVAIATETKPSLAMSSNLPSLNGRTSLNKSRYLQSKLHGELQLPRIG
jgi:hypothetical protein